MGAGHFFSAVSTTPNPAGQLGSACRVRFGYAHECGHFVGHVGRKTGDKESESEANRFASAFLLPRSTFVKEFPALRGGTQVNWIALSQLKMRWRVSKAAVLYRARQLNILSEDQHKRALLGHLFGKGERHIEHEDISIPHEQPELLHNAMTVLRERLGLSLNDMAVSVHMTRALVAEIAPLADDEHDAGNRVVSLAQFRQTREQTGG
jgi:Zn-dependent peptidase ImmA (M78 family)